MPIAGPELDAPLPFANLLQHGLQHKASELALVSEETSWTWQQLDAASERLAANLLELGLKSGDRVASLMPNRAELLVHYLACLKAELVATPLNYRYMAPEIDHALEVSGATILLAHAERDEDLAASKFANQLPLGRIGYGASDGRTPSFEQLVAAEPQSTELPTPQADSPAVIFFTSGSTGKPKGVTHTHETFGWMLAGCVAAFEMNADDLMLPGSSISHIGGFLLSFAALSSGARVDVARSFDGDELLPLLRDTRPTILNMLPAALLGLIRDHGATHEDFQSIRLCVAGGDKVSAELEREFTDLAGFPIHEIYGMSEIGLATENPLAASNKIGSIGVVAPGFEISIRDDNAAEVPIDCQGRLWVKSPCIMRGYWNHPAATAEAIVDGWLDTGDIVRIDEDGYIWFCGRKKQIIVHDGSNICPQEVEEALLEHPTVECAGVVGIHDLVHGENVRAFVTLKPDAAVPTSLEIIRFARTRIGYKAPELIEFLESMPLNATGKVDRPALKRLAEQHLGVK
jgi:long-chain acyl-CoA synthetase